MQITEQSKALFIAYVEDAPNWGGQPLVGGNVTVISEQIDKGNLTHLKKLGLLTTGIDEEDGTSWIRFTDKGIAYAKELGLEDDLCDLI